MKFLLWFASRIVRLVFLSAFAKRVGRRFVRSGLRSDSEVVDLGSYPVAVGFVEDDQFELRERANPGPDRYFR